MSIKQKKKNEFVLHEKEPVGGGGFFK